MDGFRLTAGICSEMIELMSEPNILDLERLSLDHFDIFIDEFTIFILYFNLFPEKFSEALVGRNLNYNSGTLRSRKPVIWFSFCFSSI